MRIGFDFDNTIVNYDSLFHKVALEQGLIDDYVSANKIAVRNFLRNNNKEESWTKMQGTVYGARMLEADVYPDAINVIDRLIQEGHIIGIISHKTKYPYLGEAYDLHDSARQWVQKHLCRERTPLIPENQIFFEVTKENKWERIKQFECDIFMDDLPEILLAPQFPEKTRRILFDPDGHHKNSVLSSVKTIASWDGLGSVLSGVGG
jgi:hypothetical protein